MPSASCSCIWTISLKKLAPTFAVVKPHYSKPNYFNSIIMLHKLSILIALALVSCSQSTEQHQDPAQSAAVSEAVSLPAGFTVIEQQPDGYFIRLASAERASSGSIRELADTLSGIFDRVDLCLNVAHERGDEYASIIGYQVFDHENDNIYILNPISK